MPALSIWRADSGLSPALRVSVPACLALIHSPLGISEVGAQRADHGHQLADVAAPWLGRALGPGHQLVQIEGRHLIRFAGHGRRGLVSKLTRQRWPVISQTYCSYDLIIMVTLMASPYRGVRPSPRDGARAATHDWDAAEPALVGRRRARVARRRRSGECLIDRGPLLLEQQLALDPGAQAAHASTPILSSSRLSHRIEGVPVEKDGGMGPPGTGGGPPRMCRAWALRCSRITYSLR